MKSRKKVVYEVVTRHGVCVANYDDRDRAEAAVATCNEKVPSEGPHEVREVEEHE